MSFGLLWEIFPPIYLFNSTSTLISVPSKEDDIPLLESWQRVEQSTVNRKSPTADPVFSQVPGRRVEKKGSEKEVNDCLVCNNKLIKREKEAEGD